MKKPAPADGDEASAEKTGETPVESWLHRALSIAAQAASLVGIVGFILAIVINSIIFRQWGLNFLQVATPGDVVLSGFHVALVLALPVAALFLGWIFGKYLAAKIPMLWQVLFLIACLVFTNIVQIEIDTPIPKLEHLVGFFVGGAFWGMSYYAEFVISGKNFSKDARLVAPLFLVFLLVAGVAPLTVQATRQVGMFGEGLGYGVVPAPADCLAPYVLWTGERAIVTRCGNGQITVLMYPQALQMDRIRPVPAITEPRRAQPIAGQPKGVPAANSQPPAPRP